MDTTVAEAPVAEAPATGGEEVAEVAQIEAAAELGEPEAALHGLAQELKSLPADASRESIVKVLEALEKIPTTVELLRCGAREYKQMGPGRRNLG